MFEQVLIVLGNVFVTNCLLELRIDLLLNFELATEHGLHRVNLVDSVRLAVFYFVQVFLVNCVVSTTNFCN